MEIRTYVCFRKVIRGDEVNPTFSDNPAKSLRAVTFTTVISKRRLTAAEFRQGLPVAPLQLAIRTEEVIM